MDSWRRPGAGEPEAQVFEDGADDKTAFDETNDWHGALACGAYQGSDHELTYKLTCSREPNDSHLPSSGRERIPATYFKKLIGAEEIWECRIQYGSNI